MPCKVMDWESTEENTECLQMPTFLRAAAYGHHWRQTAEGLDKALQ